MKKRMIITAIVLSFLIVAVESNAEMRITPGGVTSPDDSATLHLSGSFSGFSEESPDGAVISGVNSHPGFSFLSYSYGGYFSGHNVGVYGTSFRRGVSGTATGTYGSGVYGYASDTGDVQNYGGYFESSSTSGRGVLRLRCEYR